MYQNPTLAKIFGLHNKKKRVTIVLDNMLDTNKPIDSSIRDEKLRTESTGNYLPNAIRNTIGQRNNENNIPTGYKKDYLIPNSDSTNNRYTGDMPYGLDDPFKISGYKDDDVWIRVKPRYNKKLSLKRSVKIPKEIIHSKESLGGKDVLDIFRDPHSGARYIRPKSDRHIEPLSWRRHHVRAENLGFGKRIYRIPIWRPKIANSPVKWIVLIYIVWNYIRYYTDLLLEMIDKDIAPWEPERFDQLETIGKWLMIYADAIEKWQLDFQDPASPIMEGIINLHHDLMFFLLIIAVFVLWVLLRTVYLFDRSRGHEPSKVVHGTVLEIVWTIVPSFILLAVAIPSFALLYAIDEASDPAITIKVIGHQWYWVYEYSDYTVDSNSLSFESFMVPEADLKLGQLRLLEVDNRIVVPTNTHIRFLITSADVLHSWAVPSLGVKVDALPGRLNQATVFIKRDGVYYGQCSEICGVNHAFMPIVVESVPLDEYVSWVANQIEA